LKQLDQVLDRVERYIVRALIEAGFPVGLLASHTLSQLLMQMTLNTFHFAGSMSKIVLGFPRLKEIIDRKLSCHMVSPSMTVYLKPEYISKITNGGLNKEAAKIFTDQFASLLCNTTLDSLCTQTIISTLRTIPNRETKLFHRVLSVSTPPQQQHQQLSTTGNVGGHPFLSITFQLNREKCLLRNLSPMKIATMIHQTTSFKSDTCVEELDLSLENHVENTNPAHLVSRINLLFRASKFKLSCV
jgi:hypothetical protein